MIRTMLLAALGMVAIASCVGPDDQRYYAIGGSGIDPLPGTQGEVCWAEGRRVSSTGQMSGTATDRRLLTIIFLTPGAKGIGSEGEGMDSGGVMATFDLSNGKGAHKVDANVKWDKRRDVVEIDGTIYDRSKGTLFVIVKSPGGRGEVWQLVPPSGTEEDKDLLNYAKKELPGVRAVQDASFDRRRDSFLSA